MSFANHLPPRLALYWRLTRLDKPIGTLLLLWPTLSALWIATAGRPAWWQVTIFTLGTLLMRSAGCAVNDAADADVDVQVKRTAERVVATGRVSRREALALAAVLALAAALLLPPLDPAAWRLAVVAVLIAATYPLFKRFFPMPQAYLSIAFSFGIPMAFAGVLGQVPAVGWWLFIANLFWVVAYDTEYAMVDRDDDIRIGVRSSAILFGRAEVAAIMGCYGVFLAVMLIVGGLVRARWPYYAGCAVALLLIAYHYLLIRKRERESCFRAFLHNQWVGAALFAGIVADYALR
jgi:4-hydroxybenzoate polyprenyltransferase